jgi:hypothetical protein
LKRRIAATRDAISEDPAASRAGASTTAVARA